MKIMTFNLRFENDFDGENGWDHRKDLVTRLIANHRPCLLGTQEGTTGQLRYLQNNLAGYELLAPDRIWEEDCQYCSIFYRPELLRSLSGGEFWLSETPDVHRSTGWDSAYPRMMSYGFFEQSATGRKFCVAVTHLDNVGAEARRQQARIIREWFESYDCPKILMGDFNDGPFSEVHATLTGGGLIDTWQALSRIEDQNGSTYHKFKGVPQFFRMDWILVTPDFSVADARIIHDHDPRGRYPSDHFPYMSQLAWNH
ncbi:MAG: endonuclease/exonuclease/phosphatase family protein [Desulfobacteraceae bacterium]|nr:endonuclease/exonuclease/phosphatase family protein [Desulfobacteraceae bacterium]